MLQAYGVNSGAETRLVPFPSSGQAHSKKGKLVINLKYGPCIAIYLRTKNQPDALSF